jgi:YfiH family protein
VRLATLGGLRVLLFERLEAAGFRCVHSTTPLDARQPADRKRLAAAAGLDPERATGPVQVHSATVLRVDAPLPGPVEADGLVTDVPGLPLLLKAADCSLVAVVDPRRRAVGVAHAGWRGAARGICGNLVAALRDHYGSRPEDLLAAVGPTIGVARYAVGPEVVEAFRVPWAREYARAIGGKLHFDLAGANARALLERGIADVEVAGLCTHERADLLFSYRRQGPGMGHHGLVAGWATPA